MLPIHYENREAIQVVWKWNTTFSLDHLRLVNVLYSLQSTFTVGSFLFEPGTSPNPLDLQRVFFLSRHSWERVFLH